MKERRWITITGRLRKGYRVASGPSRAYPEYGSIEKQKPFFKKLGLNLDRMFNGTLNISIAPYEFEMKKPGFQISAGQVDGTDQRRDFFIFPLQSQIRRKGVFGMGVLPRSQDKKGSLSIAFDGRGAGTIHCGD
jgi:hypothetical protein